jgi:methyl-accepting chemotaxis protein
MKLLMENWRKFVAETERTKNYGDLYLFENDSIQKVSFYDRFSTLNESDDDFKLFLEQWEKSIDYQLGLLSEGIRDDRGRTWTSKDEAGPGEAFRWGPNAEWEGRKLTPEDMGLTQQEADYVEDFRKKYLAARGTPAHPLKDPVAQELLKRSNRHMAMNSFIPFFAQGYMLLQRGGAAVGKVMNFAKKLKDKGTLGKVGDVALLGLVAAAGAVTINSLVASGADPAEFQQAVSQVADAAIAIDPSVGQALEQVVQNPEAALEVMPQLDQAIEQSAQQLSQVDNEAVQQMAQEADKVSQQMPDNDEFARMFDEVLRQDKEAADQAREAAQQASETGIEQDAAWDYYDYSTEEFQQKGWQKKINDIGNKLFGPDSKYGQKWRKAMDIVYDAPEIRGDRGTDMMNRQEFKEFTKALKDQGVDPKAIRLVKRIWKSEKFDDLLNAVGEDLATWPTSKMTAPPPPDFG